MISTVTTMTASARPGLSVRLFAAGLAVMALGLVTVRPADAED